VVETVLNDAALRRLRSSGAEGEAPQPLRGLASQRTGVLIGGSGLIGGTVLNYFKTAGRTRFNVLSPNSKELSLRVVDDLRAFFRKVRPEFIINCAIASIEAGPQLNYEVTYLGTVNLARVALELGIPYIHISSSAIMPNGRGLTEDERVELSPDLAHYAKAKLLAELSLEHMHRTRGLDYTVVRLAVVYGSHDHKIQGFHRLLFSLVDRSMPFILAGRESAHSYSNAKKLPAFVAHVIEHREEFAGQTYHFVDPEPVRLVELILTIKRLLGTKRPREIYIPYALARFTMFALARLVRMATRVGLEARAPAEVMFLKNFYESQTLSSAKLRQSSFVDPDPDATVFTALPELIRYYLDRWDRLNLIEHDDDHALRPLDRSDLFVQSPERLLETVLREQAQPLLEAGQALPNDADDARLVPSSSR
jgi:nucleoside-diphosphate-sugar epimerase